MKEDVFILDSSKMSDNTQNHFLDDSILILGAFLCIGFSIKRALELTILLNKMPWIMRISEVSWIRPWIMWISEEPWISPWTENELHLSKMHVDEAVSSLPADLSTAPG